MSDIARQSQLEPASANPTAELKSNGSRDHFPANLNTGKAWGRFGRVKDGNGNQLGAIKLRVNHGSDPTNSVQVETSMRNPLLPFNFQFPISCLQSSVFALENGGEGCVNWKPEELEKRWKAKNGKWVCLNSHVLGGMRGNQLFCVASIHTR